MTGGLRNDRLDFSSTHEEADILIVQHAISLSLLGKSVRVVCDDTDLFVLLVHYYNSMCKCSNRAPMIMSSPVKECAVIYIRATVESHSDIVDAILAIHRHSMCTYSSVISWHRQGNGCQSCQEGGGECMLRLNMLKHRPLSLCVLHMAR